MNLIRPPSPISFRAAFKKLLIGVLLFCSPLASLPASAAAETPILAGSEIDYPPFCFVDSDGDVSGFSVELLRAALKEVGREVTFRTGLWEEVSGWLERGEVQVLPVAGRSPEREPLFDFTFPYITLYGAIVVRSETDDIEDMVDLMGRSVAVKQGGGAEEFLRREERGIDIHTTATFKQALQELSAGRYDAVIIQHLIALSLIQENSLSNLKIVRRPLTDFRQDFCFGVRQGDRDTLALLNEGLGHLMSKTAYRRLHAKWLGALELPANHGIIIGGDHNFPPFEYLDESGRPAGYNVELTRALAREMGLDIEIRLGSWTEVVNWLESGKIDAIQGMFYSPERDLRFDFTPPHTINHCVSVVRQGEGSPPTTVEELAGKRIVVERGDIMHDFAIQNSLSDRVVAVDNQEQALQELEAGKHDCALVSRIAALHIIEKHGWDNLRAAKRPLVSLNYCYAVPEGHIAMLSTLSEGLQVLKQSGEYRRIQEKWKGILEPGEFSFDEIAPYLVLILAPLLMVFLGFYLWSKALREQVALRTKELQRSQEFKKFMIACSPVALYSRDLDGNVLTWNESAERIFGWKADEVIGKPVPIFPKQWQKEIEEYRHELGQDKIVVGKEIVSCRKDGSFIIGNLSAAPIKDSLGKVIGVMGAMLDITEQQRTADALRSSEEYQKAMIAASPLAIISMSPDGRVRTWNAAAERIFGWSAAEVVGQILPTVPEDQQESFSEYRKRVVAGESLSNFEAIRLRKDGQRIEVSISTAPLRDPNDRVTGILAVVEDITERKRSEKERSKLQAQLIQSQKMESVGRLAGGVAHDFNNMLGVIIGYAELAMGEVAPEQQLYSRLQHIHEAGMRSANLTCHWDC